MNASSTCPFNVPTCFHCATKRPWARLPIRAVAITDSGTVASVTSASSGEIHTSITITPITVSMAVTIWPSACCSDVATLSMSFVTRDSTSPSGRASKYASGRRVSFACASRRSCRIVPCTR